MSTKPILVIDRLVRVNDEMKLLKLLKALSLSAILLYNVYPASSQADVTQSKELYRGEDQCSRLCLVLFMSFEELYRTRFHTIIL